METAVPEDKKPNPVQNANFLSRFAFLYMFPVFKRGFKDGLSEEQLFEPLGEHKSNVLGEKLQKKWIEEYATGKKHVLHWALFKLFGPSFLLQGLMRLIYEIIGVVVMPMAIGNLTTYFEKDQTQISKTEAYISAGAIALCRFLDSSVTHTTMMNLMHLSMKMRVGCNALIYRKILRLDRTALAETTAGQIVNLLSNDVSKFDSGFVLANFAWIAPIQAAVGTYLIYREIGVSAFFGMALLLSFIPLQAWISKQCSTLRMKIALTTDRRVRLINEIVTGIQVIKMYCWEKPFGQLVSLVRRQEIKGVRARGYLLGLVYCFEMFITRVSIFVSILGYVLLGQYITARKVFAVTAIYAVVRPIITTIFSLGFNSIAEVNVSIKRIDSFLSLPERQCSTDGIFHEKASIVLKNVSARWSSDSPESTLKDVSLEVSSNQLVGVIGTVGSGKSSLFSVILNELPIGAGEKVISGTISYSSQEPWIFNGSVRQNILFCDEFDEVRYQKVIDVCALKLDLELLPYGDKSLVGERGVSLSGGQKARINLARCIYKQADIYLLDDPLSAVDARVGKHIFDHCIKKFLDDKICLLITHQLQHLTVVDTIVVIEEGRTRILDSIRNLDNDLAKTLSQSHVEEEAQHDVGKNKDKIKSADVTIPNEESSEELPLLEKEVMQKGDIQGSVYLAYFRAGGGFCNAFLMMLVFIGAQVASSSSDYFVTYWVNREQDFAASNLTLAPLDRNSYLCTYSAIIAAVIALGIAHGIYFMYFFTIASATLHRTAFSTVLNATMRFFNKNPSGRVLNRFSRDVGNVDEYIPEIIYDVIAIALDLIAAIVLSMIVDLSLAIPSSILLLVFYLFRRIYINTSRSVKRIEGITRSPIYTHTTVSFSGLGTIRAFSAQPTLTKEFDDYQDRHSCAWFIFIASNRCFGFWLDTTCAVFVASVMFILLYFNQNLYAGDMGLVITQFIGLAGGLQWGMRQWSELENQMVSVERILEYSHIEVEPSRESKPNVAQDWPQKGEIEFVNVSLKYNPNEPAVLKNLSFAIKSGEKIGIVGRTGAGKSSIITALFQLYPTEGQILIDDQDVTKLPLEQVRSKISIIPQEPVLFSGTLRKNLDPLEEYSDETLWNALNQVELKETVAELPDLLSSNIAEGGSNFSVGQRQLLCLARALIRNNKILIMDEATANVDPYTDSLIQHTIRDKFADCTVLTVAHRLHTVMDADKILVMDDGYVVEFDPPYSLLQNKEGFFFNLVHTGGRSAASTLENMARESHLKKER